METKIVSQSNISYIAIILLMFYSRASSQSNDNVYFLINPHDTLIQKQVAQDKSLFEGYLIIDEKRLKKLNRTPTKEGKVWVPESQDDFYTFGPTFSFERENDTIISENYFMSLKIIKTREEFLKVDNGLYDLSGNAYYFLEELPNHKHKYLMRKVRPVVFE